MITTSGTARPSMNGLACCPTSLPAATWARSMSPVEM